MNVKLLNKTRILNDNSNNDKKMDKRYQKDNNYKKLRC